MSGRRLPFDGNEKDRPPRRYAAEGTSIDALRPGETIEIPLPGIPLGRRTAYQRVNHIAHALFGPGTYTLKTVGNKLEVTRRRVMHG